MKIADALHLLSVIEGLQKTPAAREIRFGYMLSANKRKLLTIREKLNEYMAGGIDPEAVKAYDEMRHAMLKAVCERDDNNEPIVENGDYKIANRDEKVAIITKSLMEKFPEVGNWIQTKQERVAFAMQVDVEVDLTTLPISDWPNIPSEMNPMIMDVVFPLIEPRDSY